MKNDDLIERLLQQAAIITHSNKLRLLFKEAASELTGLNEKMDKINNTIYCDGAPVGSERYFAIRTICCSVINDKPSKG